MPTLPFPMRDTALDEAARRILRILQAEEEAKRRFASIESSGPSRGRSINRSEVTSRSGPRDVWDSAQATIPIGPRIGPLRLPMPEPAPPLIDPIPSIPVPNPDARRTKRKNCIDQYERCYTQKWWTAPGWRCENCMKYCIANGEWPYESCRPSVADTDEDSDHKTCGGNCRGAIPGGSGPPSNFAWL